MKQPRFRVENGKIIYISEEEYEERRREDMKNIHVREPGGFHYYCCECKHVLFTNVYSEMRQHMVNHYAQFDNCDDNPTSTSDLPPSSNPPVEEDSGVRAVAASANEETTGGDERGCRDVEIKEEPMSPDSHNNNCDEYDEDHFLNKHGHDYSDIEHTTTFDFYGQGRKYQPLHSYPVNELVSDLTCPSSPPPLSPAVESESPSDDAPYLVRSEDIPYVDKWFMPLLSPQESLCKDDKNEQDELPEELTREWDCNGNAVLDDTTGKSEMDYCIESDYNARSEDNFPLELDGLDKTAANCSEHLEASQEASSDEANSAFTSKHYCNLPLVSKMQEERGRMIWCKLCDSYYPTIQLLRLHITTVHKVDASRVNIKNYATWDLEIAKSLGPPQEME